MKISSICRLLVVFILSTATSQAQNIDKEPLSISKDGKGITFQKNQSWHEIIEKARKENKHIFIDCYAAWCMPCAGMDKNVFAEERVGKFIDSNYVSVKLDMDSNVLEKSANKEWVSVARKFKESYNVEMLPTYLICDPNGEVVHKEVGAIYIDNFLAMARAVLRPENQFYTLVKQFNNNQLSLDEQRSVALTGMRIKETMIARSIAKSYLERYLYPKLKDSIPNKDDVEFLSVFVQSSSDPGFKFLLKNSKIVDSVIAAKGFTEDFIDYIVRDEMINPLVKDKPKSIVSDSVFWKGIHSKIEDKFGEKIARRVICDAQILLLEENGNKVGLSKKIVERVDQFGPFGPIPMEHFKWNWVAWSVFENSNNPKELAKALSWSNRSLNLCDSIAGYYDTYANILYKLGRTKEALKYQERAVSMAPAAEDLKATLARMRKGQKTWE